MGLKIRIINKNKISEPHTLQMDDYLNYKEFIGADFYEFD